jgi:phosphatidylinositol-3-phosphatase
MKLGMHSRRSTASAGLIAVIAVLAGLLAVPSSLGAKSRSAAQPLCGAYAKQRPPAHVRHVVWIWFENHSYGGVLGTQAAPTFNRLAAECGVANNYFAISHPSLPNYVAATSGSTQGIADDTDPSSHQLNVPSIFGQVPSGSFEESMPANCTLSDSGKYAVRHDPEAYYIPIRAQCQKNDVPLPELDAAALPRFSFVTPDVCSDMHDCSVSTGDSWLRSFLPRVTNSRAYRSGQMVVFITFDESESDSGPNHVPTLVLSEWTRPGTRSSLRFDHYSLLRTTEELLGVGLLGNAAHASSMRAPFHL